MAEWIPVLVLILLGFLLIAAEIIFIPGTTIVGFLGLGVVVTGIVIAYLDHGDTAGNIILGSSIIIFSGMVFLAFKLKVWQKFSVSSSVSGKIRSDADIKLKVGQVGTTVSALRPSGEAEFEGERYEVYSAGQFLDSGKTIEIISIEKGGRKVMVKQK
ncbi:hypothetical protein OO013_06055 [Mangrovivirga sp. M17]|uniref:NfeD-like C-terminal domain-containing protein n=1 Tax=Mangrovivirga halotolerans TaxID=2993936 RepID=A0ABT3RNM6_9BACT|nr:NfeD family protein [Mangrovivirga halotolerans]MCX2743420.1 hypothetical protein [Mangrovivirga halotolerans]